MTITKMFLTPNKYSRPQTRLATIKKVVVHYVGNPKSTAKNNRDYFNNASQHKRYISSHYIVGLQGEIIQCVPEQEVAYCSNQANAYSISVETCHPDATGKFSDVTENALIELVADICKRNSLNPLTDVIRHYDVTGKCCPMWYVKVPSAWNDFKSKVAMLMSPPAETYYIKTGTILSLSKAKEISALLNTAKCYNSILRSK